LEAILKKAAILDFFQSFHYMVLLGMPLDEFAECLTLLVYFKIYVNENLYIMIYLFALAAILKMAAILNVTKCVSIILE